MKRTTLLLLVLGVIVVLVAWYLLLWSPRVDELAVVEDEIVTLETQQASVRSRIAELQGVREEAPQLQAELAATESLLPRDAALPSALRQLQQAADDSGATLISVSPTRPELVEGSEDLYAINLNAELRGNYFQIVDVLRRVEDPAISPRGVLWNSSAMTIDEYPELITVLSGQMFAVLPQPPAPPAEADPDAEAPTDPDAEAPADTDDPDQPDEPDTEVDVDVEVDQ